MIRKNKRVINKILIIFIFVSFLFIILVKLNNKNNIKKIENLDNYKYILVNKENKLSKDFKPNNLVEVIKCSEKKFYLEKEAHNAYHQMCLDSKKEGLNILITSAYRSYDEQRKLYNKYLKLYGKNYVDKYVAKAGYSEHQTGLAIDLKSLDNEVFMNSKEYLWIKKNAHKYGFIIRYQKEQEVITGYSEEQWHIRYVGKKVAQYIYKNNIAYEEYYNLFINN